MKHFRGFSLLILAAMMVAPAVAQTPYKLPPKDVVAILDAPPPPVAIESPTRDALLLVEIRPYPSIAVLAEPVLRLAGVRINPQVGCTQRTLQFTGLSVQPLDGAPARRVALPEGTSIDIHRAGPMTARRSPSHATSITRSSSGRPTRPPDRRSRSPAPSSTTCCPTPSSGCAITATSSPCLYPRLAAPRRQSPGLRSAPTCRKARGV